VSPSNLLRNCSATNFPATVVALPFGYPWQLFGHVLAGHRNGFFSASSLTRKPDFSGVMDVLIY
jgi:hypothetical protein